MTLRAALAAAVLAHALPALAQVEGVADVKMSGDEEGGQIRGTGRIFVSPAGWRIEMDMTVAVPAHPKGPKGAAGQSHRIVTFGKKSAPGKTWMLNEKSRTYAVLEDEGQRSRDEGAGEGWKVTRLGQDRVAGFSCTIVRAQQENEDREWEACLAKDFLVGSWLEQMKQGEDEAWATAVKKAGVPGDPVRVVSRSRQGKELNRFEVVRFERSKVPASRFEVPSGYKQGSMMDVMVQSPEQRRQMEEAQRQAAESMKNMSPEQKKMMEEMMKKYGGGQK